MSAGLPIVVIGAGGHGRVVADALMAAGAQVLGFTDADPALHGQHVLGLPVLGGDEVLSGRLPTQLLLANGIGGVGRAADAGRESLRRRIQQHLMARGWRFAGVRHPSAVVSRFAQVHEDAQLLPGSVVHTGARIGQGAIVNTAAVVEHDAQVGAWCHVAPRALLCGEVLVGEGSHVGAGAIVRQGLALGPGTIVGAGAVVVRSFDGGVVLAGLPARVAKGWA